MDTEDRELFVKKLDEIDVKTIKSEAVNSIEDAAKAASELGYYASPILIDINCKKMSDEIYFTPELKKITFAAFAITWFDNEDQIANILAHEWSHHFKNHLMINGHLEIQLGIRDIVFE